MDLKRLSAGTLVLATLAPDYASAQLLNEIYASHSAIDTLEMIELKGPLGHDLDDHMVLIVEGEATSFGTLDRAWDLSGKNLDALTGFFVLGDTVVTPKDFDIGVSNTIENGTETVYLIDAGSPANVVTISGWVGTNVDLDGDLVTDIATLPGVTILDVVAMYETDDATYDGAERVGPDTTAIPSGVFPAGIFRNGDVDWCCNSFLDYDPVANIKEPRTVRTTNSVCGFAPVVYCTAGTTSSGCRPTMGSIGIASASAATPFSLTCTALEGKKSSLMFYGISGRHVVPWGMGSSFLCIKPPLQRMGLRDSGGTSGTCNGAVIYDWNAFLALRPNALGSPFSAGDCVWAQCWFRDPPAPKKTSLSDALTFALEP